MAYGLIYLFGLSVSLCAVVQGAVGSQCRNANSHWHARRLSRSKRPGFSFQLCRNPHAQRALGFDNQGRRLHEHEKSFAIVDGGLACHIHGNRDACATGRRRPAATVGAKYAQWHTPRRNNAITSAQWDNGAACDGQHTSDARRRRVARKSCDRQGAEISFQHFESHLPRLTPGLFSNRMVTLGRHSHFFQVVTVFGPLKRPGG